ncbi:MAG: DUF2442 domain-containing protein [candidate division KSB1 bacterium]|nr:DUF2442 domain-containing protein [candidate division KSB1 bacterium]MDQ7064435.1 DUF2442 domain-containing protein [candidate division KSB1 bacterium]
MSLKVKAEEERKVKRYKVQYPITEYTFPSDARIKSVRFDDQYIHVHLMDGRILSIPLRWIPTVYHAAPEMRARFEISPDKTMIIWDPETSGINDELSVADYLVSHE